MLFHQFRKKYVLDSSGSEEFFRRAVFANYGKDNSGELDAEELEQFLDTIYESRSVVKGVITLPPKEKMRDAIMKQCDTDGGGGLSYKEISGILSGGTSALVALSSTVAEDTEEEEHKTEQGDMDASAVARQRTMKSVVDARMAASSLLKSLQTPEEAAEQEEEEEESESEEDEEEEDSEEEDSEEEEADGEVGDASNPGVGEEAVEHVHADEMAQQKEAEAQAAGDDEAAPAASVPESSGEPDDETDQQKEGRTQSTEDVKVEAAASVPESSGNPDAAPEEGGVEEVTAEAPLLLGLRISGCQTVLIFRKSTEIA